MKSLVEKLRSTKRGEQAFQREVALLEVTEAVCELMERSGVTVAELARRLKTTGSYIDSFLNGEVAPTLAEVVDIFTALGHEFRLKTRALR